jgi:hypothetical protein
MKSTAALEVVVDGLHPLLGEGAGVLNAPVGEGPDDAPWPVLPAELGVFGIVGVLRLLLRVEVVQVAEELVEAVVGGEKLVLVPEVVLAELASGIAERLERLGDRDVLLA